MSNFTDFIAEPSSRKRSIFEIDLVQTLAVWLNAEAGMWKYKFTNIVENTTSSFEKGSFCYGAFEGTSSGDIGDNGIIKQVSSVLVDATEYTSVATQALCRTTNESFYYAGDTTLYVHFDGNATPYGFTSIKIGVTDSYSNEDFYNEDNQFVQGKIKSVPNIQIQKDRFYYGLQIYSGGDVTLSNEDGYFDSYVEENVYGQPCRIKIGGDTLDVSEYETKLTGYVKSFRSSDEDFIISILDKREQINRSLPVNYYDATTYPNISDNNNGRPIPIAYGECFNCPVICTNEDEVAPGSYSFTIVDVADHANGINSIDTVYVDGAVQVPATTDLATATFTFTVVSGFYTPGQDVTVTFKSYDTAGSVLIDNSLDILKDILTVYLGITYNVTNFDTTQWAAETLVAKTIGNIWIDDNTEIESIIEQIDTSNIGSLLLSGPGKWTFKRSDTTAAHTFELYIDEEFNPPNRIDDGEEFLTSATTRYLKDNNETHSSKQYRQYTDNSQEAALFVTYSTYRNKVFDTYLTSAAAAVINAEALMDLFNGVKPTFSMTTSIAGADVELLDNIILQVDRQYKTWMGLNKCEVTGISYNFNDFLITFNCRWISSWEKVDDAAVAKFTIDTPVFPASMGGGSAQTWDNAWTQEQKVYALTTFGYFSDDNNYIDGTDPDTLNKSLFGSDAV